MVLMMSVCHLVYIQIHFTVSFNNVPCSAQHQTARIRLQYVPCIELQHGNYQFIINFNVWNRKRARTMNYHELILQRRTCAQKQMNAIAKWSFCFESPHGNIFVLVVYVGSKTTCHWISNGKIVIYRHMPCVREFFSQYFSSIPVLRFCPERLSSSLEIRILTNFCAFVLFPYTFQLVSVFRFVAVCPGQYALL